jgi:RNA polymerase sigma factor (sigma-70 family)
MEIDSEKVEMFRRKLRYKVCYHVGSFCADVEDLVQETMVRFLRALNEGNIRKPESIGPFLSGICNNVILEYRRSLWRDRPEFSETTTAAQSVKSVLPEAESLELRDSIAAVMQQLSDRDRRVLCAFFLEERGADEICREMEMSGNQFRVALCRAKERFRKIYRGR